MNTRVSRGLAADHFTVLGLLGFHLPCCSGDTPILDVKGGVAMGRHTQDESYKATWSYYDVSSMACLFYH